MTAMPTERLREPEELYEPPEHDEAMLATILGNLSEEAGREFARQVLGALNRARSEGDLRPINEVVESWYRTLLFRGRPKFDDLWAEAEASEGPVLTIQDVRARRKARLGV
jgi:hypothetical protein